VSLKPIYIYKFVNGERTWLYCNVATDQTIDDEPVSKALISHTAPTITQDATKANVDITVPFDNPVVTLYGPFPPFNETQVYIYKFYAGITEPTLTWQGRLIRVEFNGSNGVLKCDTTLSGLDTEGLPETHQNLCNNYLYDGRCPVQAASFRQPITVTLIDGNDVTVTGITQIDTWFRGGTFQAPNGDWRFITEHIGDVLTLDNPFPAETLAADDNTDIYAGCDRLYNTCVVKFGAETGDGAAFGGNPIVPHVNPHEYGRLL
jgi:uncharacterized phage protein (TIGR02218 family)